jgi:hypothetical protein
MSVATEQPTAAPTFELQQVGPEEAKALLSMNTHNRGVNRRAVNEYALAMTRGDWKFDASPIRLADDGLLLDGQHRLEAVIESGTTQPMLVVMGVEKEAQKVMDTGRKRSFANVLTLEGEKDTTGLAAVILMHYRWVNGLRGERLFRPGGGITSSAATAEVLIPQNATLLAHFHENLWLRDTLRPGAAISRFTNLPPRIATFAYALIHQIPNVAADEDFFWDRLKTGIGLEEDSPILQLRNRLADAHQEKLRGSHVVPQLLLAYVFKSWNFYREGAQMKRLMIKLGGAFPDKFPEPK